MMASASPRGSTWRTSARSPWRCSPSGSARSSGRARGGDEPDAAPGDLRARAAGRLIAKGTLTF
jgi:hypothetical protein